MVEKQATPKRARRSPNKATEENKKTDVTPRRNNKKDAKSTPSKPRKSKNATPLSS